MSNIFTSVETLSTPRSFQNMKFGNRTTYTLGKLYPSFAMDCVPGDTIKIGMSSIVKCQPLSAPSMTPMKMTTHFFFVPYRLLDENFGQKVTGMTEDGHVLENIDFPLWSPDDSDIRIGSLWDYFGLPINVDNNRQVITTNCTGVEPTAYLKRAYNFIYNKMYRNENFSDEIDLDSNNLQYRCWRADYFTKALPWQQKPGYDVGSMFSLPVNPVVTGNIPLSAWDSNNTRYQNIATPQVSASNACYTAINTDFPPSSSSGGRSILSGVGNLGYGINASDINISSSTFDMSDLRLVAQMQKWAERNARTGSGRYDEYIFAHFAVKPRDSRLQLPEFIGGFKTPIVIGDSFQTSSTVEGSTTETVQGNRIGIGNAIGGSYTRSYFVEEFGIILGITSILPQAEYSQGMPRQWIKHDSLDFFRHELCCLSEREVYTGELVCSSDSDNVVAEKMNKFTFGYQGMYDEMRFFNNQTTGEMRTFYNYWHQSRLLDAGHHTEGTGSDSHEVPNTLLNQSFVECQNAPVRPFVDHIHDQFMTIHSYDVKAFRPVTYRSNPGLTDHF